MKRQDIKNHSIAESKNFGKEKSGTWLFLDPTRIFLPRRAEGSSMIVADNLEQEHKDGMVILQL